uniref:Uncharacterized protein n=1 Tax=Panagrolaimus davidi TaxID=227884 RepID=A0A914P1L4_9BILA
MFSHPFASSSTSFSQKSLTSINGRPQIKFVFRDNLCAIKVLKKGIWELLQDHFGNVWTPLYHSTAEATVATGKKAEVHYEKFPKHVVFDVLKIIGKPLNEIKIDPKWGFKLVEKNGVAHFYTETIFGAKLYTQEMILSAFFKALKLQTVSIANVKFEEIRISTDFELNESQKAIFEKAAEMNFLKIVSFHIENVE